MFDSTLANITNNQSESLFSLVFISAVRRLYEEATCFGRFNMKAAALILLFAFCSIECRKIVPLNKNANIDFINMEAGGVRVQPAVQPQPKQPAPAPVVPTPAATPVAPAPTTKAPTPAVKPQPQPSPQKPAQPAPTQIKPVPVNPAPVANPITTPGPGSVKSLINFYDGQGKASPIRPYSYSQAVKQG